MGFGDELYVGYGRGGSDGDINGSGVRVFVSNGDGEDGFVVVLRGESQCGGHSGTGSVGPVDSGCGVGVGVGGGVAKEEVFGLRITQPVGRYRKDAIDLSGYCGVEGYEVLTQYCEGIVCG